MINKLAPSCENLPIAYAQNKGTDQLCGYSNRAADQRLCFDYKDSTIPLLPKSEISSLQPSRVAVQPGVTLRTGFLMAWLNLFTRQTFKFSVLLLQPGRANSGVGYYQISCVTTKPVFMISDTNRDVQSQKMGRGFNFQF